METRWRLGLPYLAAPVFRTGQRLEFRRSTSELARLVRTLAEIAWTIPGAHMSTCWPCAHPSAHPSVLSIHLSSAPDPVGVCYICNCLACSPHSGINGAGKLICAFCAALMGVTPTTYPRSSPGPGSLGGGGTGPGGSGGLPVGGPRDPGGSGGAAASTAHFLPEPHPLGDVPPFRSLRQALRELPDLYGRGLSYRLPADMQPERLIDDARREWHTLYGTELTPQSLDMPLAAAAVGLALWAARVQDGHSVNAEETDLPWLVRIPLIRVAVSVRVPA